MRWPTSDDLLAWHLHWSLGARDDVPEPEEFLKWIQEFWNKPLLYWHRRFWETDDHFKTLYHDPGLLS